MAPEKSEWDRSFNKDFSSSVLFTADPNIVERFKMNVNYNPSKAQSVQLINERKIMNKNQMRPKPSEEFVFDESSRP